MERVERQPRLVYRVRPWLLLGSMVEVATDVGVASLDHSYVATASPLLAATSLYHAILAIRRK
jgi:uncharacterized membrane protein